MTKHRNEAEVTGINRLSEEEVAGLIDDAVKRIESIDGVDYLDGWPLPPSDEDVWQPRTYKGTMTYGGINETTGKPEYFQRTYEFESTLTNQSVRDTNIRCIAEGIGPLYITWGQLADSLTILTEQRQARLDDSWKGKLAGCLGIKLHAR